MIRINFVLEVSHCGRKSEHVSGSSEELFIGSFFVEGWALHCLLKHLIWLLDLMLHAFSRAFSFRTADVALHLGYVVATSF